VFATLVLFENLAERKLDIALAKVSDDFEENFNPDDSIYKAFVKACSIRVWRRKTREEIKTNLRKKLTEEFKKEYKE
jgi:hypothetical protein